MTKAYYYENNAYNGILLTNGDRWISYSDIIDGIDINRENIPQIVENFTKWGFDDSDFEGIWGTNIAEQVRGEGVNEVLEEQDTFKEIYTA